MRFECVYLRSVNIETIDRHVRMTRKNTCNKNEQIRRKEIEAEKGIMNEIVPKIPIQMTEVIWFNGDFVIFDLHQEFGIWASSLAHTLHYQWMPFAKIQLC